MDFKIAGLESPPDNRDFQLGKITVPVVPPAEWMPDYSELPIYYQNGQPSCGGHAGARGINLFEWLENKANTPLSPRFVYALCKKIDGVPAAEGTHLRAIMTVLKNYGVCEDKYFPNDVSLPPDEYKDWTKIPQEAYDDAAKRQIKSYAFLDDRSLIGIKQAIWQNTFVIALKKPWLKDVYPSGHFIVFEKYQGPLYYGNSFGIAWGDRGYGTLKDTGEIIEAAVAVDLPNWVISNLKQQKTLLTKLAELYAKLISLKKGRST